MACRMMQGNEHLLGAHLPVMNVTLHDRVVGDVPVDVANQR